MSSQHLPAQQQAQTIMALLDSSDVKQKLAMAIPKHLTVDRLLRVAMSAIRINPMLLKCTPQSLLSCVMGCAQLGLEPEPFLGQAYLVPYRNAKKNVYEAQLIPGYRGYIALARRSGEVQTVMSQAVFERDHFHLKLGVDATIEHEPADGDRGEFRGAYVVFKYRDGSYSFDYMSKADIDKIRARSKAKDSGPWVTDYVEMAKKTVVRRHVKLVPLSVELARAAQAEDLALGGKSQVNLFATTPDMIEPGELGGEYDVEALGSHSEALESFDALAEAQGADKALLAQFVASAAATNGVAEDALKVGAAERFEEFWSAFQNWRKQAAKEAATGEKGGKKTGGAKQAEADPVIICPKTDSPINPNDCPDCVAREGCPALED